MASFDRSYTTFYWSAIVSIDLVPFSSYLTLNNIVNLKSGLKVTEDHSNWYNSKAWVRFPSPSIVTMAVSLAVYEIFSVKKWRDFEHWVRGCSRSLKMAPLDRP